MDRLFLDGNVPFFCGHRPGRRACSGLEARGHRLVELPLRVGWQRGSPRQRRSAGVAHQAVNEGQRAWLTRLSRSLHLFEVGQTLLPSGICRPEKDVPVQLAAIEARATLTECTSDIYPVCPIVCSFLALCDSRGRKLVACPRLSPCFSR